MSEDKKVKETIAKNILFYRKKNKLTQKELADAVGVKNSAISNWENGSNSIDIETLFSVCKVLGVSISTMFGVENEVAAPITKDHQQLIAAFDKLNPTGKSKLLEYANDLSEQRKYTETENFRNMCSYDFAIDITPDFEKVGAKNND